MYGDYASDPAPPVSPPVSDSVEPTCLAQACLDIVKAKYCATDSSGTQVCTDAIGDDGATPKNCAIGDGIAVCAGTPDAPLPNWTPVPDPLQDQSIKLVDNDGNVVNSQLTFYDTTGQGNNSDPGDGATTSGSTGNGGNNGSQGSADQNGKCSDGSTPSAGGCAAGYTDNGCDAPPTCSGDPLLCAQLRETHAQRCASAKARADAATARSSDAAYLDGVAADGDGPEHSPGDAWVSGQVGTGTSVDVNDGGTGDASSKLEIKRYWGSRHECPGAPEVPVPGLTEAMTYSMCKGGSYLAAFILAMGYVFGTLAFAATVSGD
ncbi:hypothetical protein [Oleiagrimonas soli]|uniref:Uncharacterized protein n=1 Tax=Oleiagrimonas soli TaxID=1543381 RepID=A0A841KEB9_9GAMM|nr:hypothetical protein [Oleiagrimonas soli]MBB6183285.1 hypothetical protein [Oleiagrimonas soli]